jgi:hypothetical protein
LREIEGEERIDDGRYDILWDIRANDLFKEGLIRWSEGPMRRFRLCEAITLSMTLKLLKTLCCPGFLVYFSQTNKQVTITSYFWSFGRFESFFDLRT